MPIKGLTTNRDRLGFPQIGVIRKGAKKPDDRHIGKDLTYFRAVFSEHEAEAAARFLEVYGEQPREINVLLPFKEIDRNFEAWQEEYTAGALQHRCDGETCVIWRDKAGELHHEPKPCPGGCKPTGKLRVIIPELRRLAYVVVLTTSKWDIVELTGNLEGLAELTKNGVNGIPLVLKRRPRKISTPSANGKRARREKWMLSIEADPAWVDAQIEHMKLLSMPGTVALAAIEAPVDLLTGEILEEYEDEYEEDAEREWREIYGDRDIHEILGKDSDAAEWDEQIAEENGDGEPEPEAEGHQQPESKKPVRPFEPETLRTYMRRKAGWTKDNDGEYSVRPPDDKQMPPDDQAVQRLASVVEDAIANPLEKASDTALRRHSIYHYMFLRTSGKELTAAETAAMLAAWADDGGESYRSNEYATAECEAILTTEMVAVGQEELPL